MDCNSPDSLGLDVRRGQPYPINLHQDALEELAVADGVVFLGMLEAEARGNATPCFRTEKARSSQLPAKAHAPLNSGC